MGLSWWLLEISSIYSLHTQDFLFCIFVFFKVQKKDDSIQEDFPGKTHLDDAIEEIIGKQAAQITLDPGDDCYFGEFFFEEFAMLFVSWWIVLSQPYLTYIFVYWANLRVSQNPLSNFLLNVSLSGGLNFLQISAFYSMFWWLGFAAAVVVFAILERRRMSSQKCFYFRNAFFEVWLLSNIFFLNLMAGFCLYLLCKKMVFRKIDCDSGN